MIQTEIPGKYEGYQQSHNIAKELYGVFRHAGVNDANAGLLVETQQHPEKLNSIQSARLQMAIIEGLHAAYTDVPALTFAQQAAVAFQKAAMSPNFHNSQTDNPTGVYIAHADEIADEMTNRLSMGQGGIHSPSVLSPELLTQIKHDEERLHEEAKDVEIAAVAMEAMGFAPQIIAVIAHGESLTTDDISLLQEKLPTMDPGSANLTEQILQNKGTLPVTWSGYNGLDTRIAALVAATTEKAITDKRLLEEDRSDFALALTICISASEEAQAAAVLTGRHTIPLQPYLNNLQVALQEFISAPIISEQRDTAAESVDDLDTARRNIFRIYTGEVVDPPESTLADVEASMPTPAKQELTQADTQTAHAINLQGEPDIIDMQHEAVGGIIGGILVEGSLLAGTVLSMFVFKTQEARDIVQVSAYAVGAVGIGIYVGTVVPLIIKTKQLYDAVQKQFKKS